jgi:hypothetical protein
VPSVRDFIVKYSKSRHRKGRKWKAIHSPMMNRLPKSWKP